MCSRPQTLVINLVCFSHSVSCHWSMALSFSFSFFFFLDWALFLFHCYLLFSPRKDSTLFPIFPIAASATARLPEPPNTGQPPRSVTKAARASQPKLKINSRSLSSTRSAQKRPSWYIISPSRIRRTKLQFRTRNSWCLDAHFYIAACLSSTKPQSAFQPFRRGPRGHQHRAFD